MISISLRKAVPEKTRTAALVVGVVGKGSDVRLASGGEGVAAAYGRSFPSTLKALKVKAKVGEVTKIPGGDAVSASVVVLVGLGDQDDVPLESLRRGVGSAVRSLAGASSVALTLPADTPERVRAIAEAIGLGGYAFTRYLSEHQTEPVGEAVILTGLARRRDARSAVEVGTTVAEAVNATRDMVNTPSNDLDPVSMADRIAELAKGGRVRVKVLDDAELERAGYGGILGVGKGSATPPRLVRLSYRPRGAKAHLGFVGKGITFDSGGLSLKPTSSMVTMKCDMSGAAAVVMATLAIAELRLPVRLTAYVSLAENMISGASTRPGDVLTMYGGKTVEVLNTDAEGRLVLADALVTASEDKPDLLVDVATLTGGCVVALGESITGVMSNDDGLLRSIPELAARAGEEMWPLPITDEVVERVKGSKIADLAQVSTKRAASASFAAAFLREFVADGIPWVHLDIAGPAFNANSPSGYTPKGGTGAAVRTLIQLATEHAE
ncbi:MAG: leucyl aminopeptidase [Propionibacteriales bacterium]|nr:leucyl aminopeptidase [Propionibacteriales bacterium]